MKHKVFENNYILIILQPEGRYVVNISLNDFINTITELNEKIKNGEILNYSFCPEFRYIDTDTVGGETE